MAKLAITGTDYKGVEIYVLDSEHHNLEMIKAYPNEDALEMYLSTYVDIDDPKPFEFFGDIQKYTEWCMTLPEGTEIEMIYYQIC